MGDNIPDEAFKTTRSRNTPTSVKIVMWIAIAVIIGGPRIYEVLKPEKPSPLIGRDQNNNTGPGTQIIHQTTGVDPNVILKRLDKREADIKAEAIAEQNAVDEKLRASLHRYFLGHYALLFTK